VHVKSLVALSLVAAGCAPAAVAPSPAPRAVSVDRLLDSLPLRDRIAQLVVPWIAGNYSAFDDAAFGRAVGWVDSLHVGGIIVSIGSPLDVAAKLNHLQERSPLPLLIASDLESGTTIRLIGGTPFPPNMGVGASGKELDAYEVGRVTALEGRAVGIHLTFAPVADVNNNPANPIINTRSFGEDPQAVARLVGAAVKGIQDHGMLATAKHFPGHGDTGTDSHIALPVITAGWARLDTVELVPFRAAIAAGVTAVMSAHIALPGLDSGRTRPGTVAPNILTGILRDSLGFKGLVVTDALNMGALVTTLGAGEAPVLAFEAGADILLQPADPAVTIAAMEQAVRSGRITEARLNRSVRKVLALKQRLGLFRRRTVPLDSVPAVVGRADFLETAREIAARSIVLARDSGGAVDSLRAAPRALSLVAYADESSPAAGSALAAELRARGHRVTLVRLSPPSGPASYDSARTALAANPMAVFAVAVRATASRGTIAMPVALAALLDSSAIVRPTTLVSLGSPYIATQAPHVGSYLLAWAANPVSEQAAARAVSGAAITGKLPVRLPPDQPVGAGLERAAIVRSTP
jgi:beta-N-acetylhexosaminidase